MRILFASLFNLVRLLLALLSVPGRLARSRRRPTYIRFRLKGDPPYRTPVGRRLRLLRRRAPGAVTSLEALRRQLTIAAADSRVRGVLFELEGLTAPAAKRQAIAELFEIVRKAGKEVVAFAITATTSEYALLCCADRIVMPAAGRLELTGFSVEATAIGGGLRRLGVAAHFVRRGDHKIAPEMFTHETISDIQRRTLEAFLDERYDELIGLIARGRRISEEEARRKVDGGPYSARRALAEGLCDALCSEADLEELLAPEGSRLASFERYAAALPFPPVRWRPLRAPPRLGLVKIDGIIAEGDGWASPFGRGLASSTALVKTLRAAAKDRTCRAVLLYVNSPGGSATASEIIVEEVRRLAKKKPVVAYSDRVAASGGYMAAMGAREFLAGPHAIIGSIGVFAGKFDLSGLLERLGIRREVISRGAHAGLHSSSRAFTPDEKQALEQEVEETYQAFLEQVAASRRMSREEVHLRAEGRIYSGAVALREGLVDGTASFEGACRRALELAGVRAEHFALRPFSTAGRRLSILGALAQLGHARVYALMFPWVEIPETRLSWGAEGL